MDRSWFWRNLDIAGERAKGANTKPDQASTGVQKEMGGRWPRVDHQANEPLGQDSLPQPSAHVADVF